MRCGRTPTGGDAARVTGYRLRAVTETAHAPRRANPDDQVVEMVEPADAVREGVGRLDVPLEPERLGELHRRDAVVRLGAEGILEVLDRRVGVAAP